MAAKDLEERLKFNSALELIACHAGYDCGPPVGPTLADLMSGPRGH